MPTLGSANRGRDSAAPMVVLRRYESAVVISSPGRSAGCLEFVRTYTRRREFACEMASSVFLGM